jgi:esterase/lipase superfamily enzyme
MRTVYHRFFSKALGQDFELKSYGSAGKPVMAFPTSCGRFYDYEDRGMIDAAREFIENGDVRIFAVDGRDRESWYKPVKDEWSGRRHERYETCIAGETADFLRESCGIEEKFLATGNSFGAFHAVNFFLKYPRLFDSAVCLSGVYGMRKELGGYWDESFSRADPLSYFPGITAEDALKEFGDGYAVIAHGRGAWEIFNAQAFRLAELMKGKGITCWYDAWDETWPHDWRTWHAQIRKYLGQFSEGVLCNGGMVKVTGPGRRLAKRAGMTAR